MILLLLCYSKNFAQYNWGTQYHVAFNPLGSNILSKIGVNYSNRHSTHYLNVGYDKMFIVNQFNKKPKGNFGFGYEFNYDFTERIKLGMRVYGRMGKKNLNVGYIKRPALITVCAGNFCWKKALPQFKVVKKKELWFFNT